MFCGVKIFIVLLVTHGKKHPSGKGSVMDLCGMTPELWTCVLEVFLLESSTVSKLKIQQRQHCKERMSKSVLEITQEKISCRKRKVGKTPKYWRDCFWSKETGYCAHRPGAIHGFIKSLFPLPLADLVVKMLSTEIPLLSVEENLCRCCSSYFAAP